MKHYFKIFLCLYLYVPQQNAQRFSKIILLLIGNIWYVEYGEREQMLLVNFFKSNNNASCVFPLVQFQFFYQANIDFIQYRFAVFSFFAGFISLVVEQLTKFSLGSFQGLKQLLVSLLSIPLNISACFACFMHSSFIIPLNPIVAFFICCRYCIVQQVIVFICIIYSIIYIQLNVRKETKVLGTQEFHVTIFSLLIITLYRNQTIQQKGITYYMTSFGVLLDVRFTS